MERLRPGDQVFLTEPGVNEPTHVGIYVGRGNMIHTSKQLQRVALVSIEGHWYRKHFRGGRDVSGW